MNNAASSLPAVQDPQKQNVALLHAQRNDLVNMSIGQAMQVAKSLYASGYFEKVKNPEQAFAKILAGQELGIGPMQALATIHIVEGKPTLDATLVRARIKSSGKYDVKTLVSTDEKCTLQFLEHGRVLGTCTFTIEDAKRAGLLGKQNWQKYPKAMNLARCTMAGAREFTPDVFGGPIYAAEELEATPQEAPQQQQPKDVTPQAIDQEKLEQGRAAIKKLIVEKQLAEEIVTAEWANLIGGAAATYPTWEDGEVAMLRAFFKQLLDLPVVTSSGVEASPEPVTIEGEAEVRQAPVDEVKAEVVDATAETQTPEDALKADLDSFAPPAKMQVTQSANMIDPKVIEEYHGFVSPIDIRSLCVIAGEAGLSESDFRDIVKRGTKGHPFTKSTYEEVLRVVEALKARGAA